MHPNRQNKLCQLRSCITGEQEGAAPLDMTPFDALQPWGW